MKGGAVKKAASKSKGLGTALQAWFQKGGFRALEIVDKKNPSETHDTRSKTLLKIYYFLKSLSPNHLKL